MRARKRYAVMKGRKKTGIGERLLRAGGRWCKGKGLRRQMVGGAIRGFVLGMEEIGI